MNLALENFKVGIQLCILCFFPPNLPSKSWKISCSYFNPVALSSSTETKGMSQHMGIQFDGPTIYYCLLFASIVQAQSNENEYF